MKRQSAAVLASALLLAGCSTDERTEDGAVEITASIYPLEYVAAEIGGDHVSVTTVTPPGSDDHSLELSPRQVTDLARVDLVLTLSGYQAAMDDAVDTTEPARVIDAADHVDLIDWSAHGDHEDHDHAEGHDHSGPDPHFWLDPSRLALLAEPVAEDLAQIDPDHADEYRANAERLVEELEQLDADYRAGLAQCDRSTFVVSHAAFGYLADSYGLDQQAIAGLEIDTEPSPRRVAEVTSLIEQSGVDVIFTTSEAEHTLISALAEESGVRVDVLDAGATQIDGEVDYDALMRSNLDRLTGALGCR